MSSYNPEKRAWRGRSYKKGGKNVRELRDEGEIMEETTSVNHEIHLVSTADKCTSCDTNTCRLCEYGKRVCSKHVQEHLAQNEE